MYTLGSLEKQKKVRHVFPVLNIHIISKYWLYSEYKCINSAVKSLGENIELLNQRDTFNAERKLTQCIHNLSQKIFTNIDNYLFY